MKKLLYLIMFVPLLVKAQTPSPKLFLLGVDSAFNSVVTSFYLSQVGISGRYENLLNIPVITINGESHSVTDGQTWTVSVSSPVLSVFGRTGAVTASNGDYTTTQVTEGTNLYWTTTRGDARYPVLSGSYSNPSWITSLAAAKITGLATVATTGAYSDLTGKPTIYSFTGSSAQYTKGDGTYAIFPTNVSAFTNDAGYLTSTSAVNVLSKSASYTVVSGDFASSKQPVIILSVDASGGAVTQTLPTSSITVGSVVKVVKTDATSNIVTIANLSYDNKIGTQNLLKEMIWSGSAWIQN